MAEGYSSAAPQRKEDSPGDIKFYQAEIRAYKRTFDLWEKRGEQIVKYYRDDDKKVTKSSDRWTENRYNLLWSNAQTLQPAIYSRPPVPECERRYKDKDPIARLAAEIEERIGSFLVEETDVDAVCRKVRDDYLLPGRGTAWVRYTPKLNTEEVLEEDEDGPVYDVSADDLTVDYVLWKSFGHNCCRSWDYVRRVWREHYMDRHEATRRFGKAVADKLKYSNTSKEYEQDKYAEEDGSKVKKACIIELWDKDTKWAYWFEKDGTKFIDSKPDPLKLQAFFPCPKPLYSNLTTDSLIPVPFFLHYKERQDDLNELMKRRRILIKAIKAIGTYDSSQPELAKLFSMEDLKLLPSNNWAQFQQTGGIKGTVDFIPIDQYVKALEIVESAIEREKQFIYELSAVNDTIRGYSDPRRTATAEEIQGNFATLRLEESQKEMARFARDLVRIMIEIAIEHYSPETLVQMANVSELGAEAQQNAAQAFQLLKDDRQRTFKISVDTESTIALNENRDKQRRIEAMDAYGRLIKEIMPMMQAQPQLAPMFKEILLFGIRTFRGGRQLEYAIEQSVDQLIQQVQQGGQPPSPEQIKAQLEQKAQEQEMQAKQADLQLKAQELQLKQQDSVNTIQLEQFKTQKEMELERFKVESQIQLEREKLQAEIGLKAAEFQLKTQTSIADQEFRNAEVQRQQVEKASGSEGGAARNGKAGPIELNLTLGQSGKKRITVQRDPVTNTATGMIEDVSEV